MQKGLRLWTVAGFPIAVSWSALVIVLLLTWGLAGAVLPEAAPGHTTSTYWLAGAAGTLVLLGSLLLHELAHALVAQRAGLEVTGLTLWVFGGVATLRGEVRSPQDDLRIAAAGPATSLLLTGVFGVAWLVLASTGQPDLVVAVVGWLAGINLLLAVFNLVPGAPLDGGRILRALLWRRTGDRYRAATTATTAGQVVAFGLIALGLLAVTAGDAVGGLWRARSSCTSTRPGGSGPRTRSVAPWSSAVVPP